VLHSTTGKRRWKTPVQRPVEVISAEKLVQGVIANNQMVLFRVVTLPLARFKGQPQKVMRDICSCQDNALTLEKTTPETAIALAYDCGTANQYQQLIYGL